MYKKTKNLESLVRHLDNKDHYPSCSEEESEEESEKEE